MNEMSKLISDFCQIQKKYEYLKDINIYRNIDGYMCTDCKVEMFLCDVPYCNGDSILNLRFEGVKNLKFGELDGLLIAFISIKDISGDQLEKINFKITENENDLFSFFCEGFEYKILAEKCNSDDLP